MYARHDKFRKSFVVSKLVWSLPSKQYGKDSMLLNFSSAALYKYDLYTGREVLTLKIFIEVCEMAGSGRLRGISDPYENIFAVQAAQSAKYQHSHEKYRLLVSWIRKKVCTGQNFNFLCAKVIFKKHNCLVHHEIRLAGVFFIFAYIFLSNIGFTYFAILVANQLFFVAFNFNISMCRLLLISGCIVWI